MVIVADTSALLALMDMRDPHHVTLRETLDAGVYDWIVPWAIIPEIDHLARKKLGRAAADVVCADLAEGRFPVEWGDPHDLRRALELNREYRDLSLGLVDGVVMAVAERLDARAIVTLDLRDFGAVTLKGQPEVWPRDL